MTQSIRKHVSQMDESEILFLFQQALSVDEWTLDPHIRRRMSERGMVDIEGILDVLRFGDLIEYHLKDGRSRILVRGTGAYYNYVPCVVYEIKSKKVITFYWNRENDHHRTIDMKLYSDKINVLQEYNISA